MGILADKWNGICDAVREAHTPKTEKTEDFLFKVLTTFKDEPRESEEIIRLLEELTADAKYFLKGRLHKADQEKTIIVPFLEKKD